MAQAPVPSKPVTVSMYIFPAHSLAFSRCKAGACRITVDSFAGYQPLKGLLPATAPCRSNATPATAPTGMEAVIAWPSNA